MVEQDIVVQEQDDEVPSASPFSSEGGRNAEGTQHPPSASRFLLKAPLISVELLFPFGELLDAVGVLLALLASLPPQVPRYRPSRSIDWPAGPTCRTIDITRCSTLAFTLVPPFLSSDVISDNAPKPLCCPLDPLLHWDCIWKIAASASSYHSLLLSVSGDVFVPGVVSTAPPSRIRLGDVCFVIADFHGLWSAEGISAAFDEVHDLRSGFAVHHVLRDLTQPALQIFYTQISDDCGPKALATRAARKDFVLIHGFFNFEAVTVHVPGPLGWGGVDDGFDDPIWCPRS